MEMRQSNNGLRELRVFERIQEGGDGMIANEIASLICIGLLGGDVITGASAGKVVFHALLLFINSVLWIWG